MGFIDLSSILALLSSKDGVWTLKEDMIYVPKDLYDALTQLAAQDMDKELRESMEEKPKKEHVGFDNTNKFFKRGKRR